MRSIRGIGLIVTAAILWGTTGTAQALGPPSDPTAVGALRLIVAAPALLLIAGSRRRLLSWRTVTTPGILVAALGMAAYQPLFFYAVEATGVALGTVVAIGSAPVLAGIIGWLFDGERPERSWLFATVVAVTGVGLLVMARQAIGADLEGLVAALGAGLAFAAYISASRRVVGAYDALGGTAIVFSLAAVISIPLLGLSDASGLASLEGALMLAHLGVVATALAYVLFSTGLRTTPTAPAATASLAEPATAAALGVALLGETPGALGWSGIGLILAGLLWLASARPKVVADSDSTLPSKGWG